MPPCKFTCNFEEVHPVKLWTAWVQQKLAFDTKGIVVVDWRESGLHCYLMLEGTVIVRAIGKRGMAEVLEG